MLLFEIFSMILSMIVGFVVLKFILIQNLTVTMDKKKVGFKVAIISIMILFSLFQIAFLGDRPEHLIIYYLYYLSLTILLFLYFMDGNRTKIHYRTGISWIPRNWYLPKMIILILIILFIFSQNLFVNNIVTLDDYPYYYYQLYFISSHSITDFNSIFGFSNYFNAGMPEVPLPYVGFNLLLLPFILFGVNIGVLIQIVIILGIIFAYLIEKELLIFIQNDKNASNLKALFVFAFPLWIFIIFYGQIAFILSCYIIIYLLLHLYRDIVNNSITQNKVFLYGIISGFSILIHLSMLFMVLALGLIFVMYFRQKYSLKYWITTIFISFGLGVLFIISFWIFPLMEILYYSGFTDILMKNFLEVFENYILNYSSGILEVNLGRLPFILYLFIIFGIYLGIKTPKNEFEHFINYSIIFLFIIIVISSFLPIFYFLGPIRFLTVIEILYIVPLCRVIDQLVLTNIKNNGRTNKNKILYVILIITSLFSIRLNFYNPDIDFTNKDEKFFNMIDWLNKEENFIPNSRILFQELSHDRTNHYYSGGHNVFYIPLLTNFSVVTGADIFNIYQKVTNVGFYDNTIFNTTIENIDNPSLYYWLDFFSVSYIIGNTSVSYDFFSSNSNFELKYNNSLLYIFYYKNFNPSAQFLHSNSSSASWRLEEASQNRYRYLIQNVSKNDHFIVSLFNIKNWRIYYNGTEYEPSNKLEQSEFINFQIPDSGNFEIKIEWNRSELEIYSILISLSMVPIFLVIKKRGFLEIKKNEVQYNDRT